MSDEKNGIITPASLQVMFQIWNKNRRADNFYTVKAVPTLPTVFFSGVVKMSAYCKDKKLNKKESRYKNQRSVKCVQQSPPRCQPYPFLNDHQTNVL